ncbi:YdgA family protein [Aliikangiella sp. IMCC44359]|uniref:YdgA family protein n=1 Tax=Aliikangiella sp. IMCC44359 TaxID=3459125 RepID=UPI00403AB060
MKKLIILIIATAILLIPPYFIGSKVETILRDQIKKSNVNPSYQIEITDYQKGWFSSSAKMTIALKLPSNISNTPEPVHITVNQNMQHGPLLWKVDGIGIGLVDAIIDFELPKELQSELDKIEELNKDTISITSRTNFDLSTKTKLALKPFTINKEGAVISVKEGTGSFEYDMSGRIAGDSTWQGMSVKDGAEKSFEFGKVTFDIDQQLVIGEMFSPDAIYAGDFNTNITSIALNTNNPAENFSLQNLNLLAKSDVNKEIANIKVVVNMKTLESFQQEFKDLVYDLSFENLDTQVLRKINQALVESQENADPMQSMAKVQGLLPQLIAKNPIIKINKLGVITKDGEIDSDLELAFDQEVYDPNNPMSMMLAIDAQAKGHAPEAFFTGFGLSQQIEQMIQQKILVRDNNNLTFNFTFKSGQALLNGAPIPLGGF